MIFLSSQPVSSSLASSVTKHFPMEQCEHSLFIVFILFSIVDISSSFNEYFNNKQYYNQHIRQSIDQSLFYIQNLVIIINIFIIEGRNMEQNDLRSTVYKGNVNINHLITSILEDSEMTQEFVIDQEENEAESEQSNKIKIIKNKQDRVEKNERYQSEEKIIQTKKQREEEKINISRFQHEIKVNNLKITPIQGQAFLLLVNSSLQGKNNQQKGRLMMTSYRLVFFNDEGIKRVDVPYGLILEVLYEGKRSMLEVRLKYPHQWKFAITENSAGEQLRNFIQIYYKFTNIKNHFAFQYALKVDNNPYSFDVVEEYKRLHFHQNSQNTTLILNQLYSICSSYPESVYVGTCLQSYFKLAGHRKNNRFPILAYIYSNHHSNINVPLWISSGYSNNHEDHKNINAKAEKSMIKGLTFGLNIQIFIAEAKNNKVVDQSHFFNEKLAINYMKLQTSTETSLAFHNIFEVYLGNKTPFLKKIINSKWYEHIKNILYNCQIIRNIMLKEHAALIRCQSGLDKSLLMASLLQVILDPEFRTFKGFESLVMRMFVHNGYPFGSRLGTLSNNKQINHTFFQFLDCVSQLINQNTSSFQFNCKYLAKIGNLMNTNIYGTFLCNSSKQYIENDIERQTISIWSHLITPITTNGFYNHSKGILRIEWQLNSLRIWKEFFAQMITKKKDHYKLRENIQDNEDYLNIFIQGIKQSNNDLKAKMKQKVAQIQKLKLILADKQKQSVSISQ